MGKKERGKDVNIKTIVLEVLFNDMDERRKFGLMKLVLVMVIEAVMEEEFSWYEVGDRM